MINDVFGTIRNLFQPAESAISKTFTSGVELARSLTKPISNVVTHENNYPSTASESTTSFKDSGKTKNPLSFESVSLIPSYLGTIVEKVIEPFVIVTNSKQSEQKTGGQDTLTTSSKTEGFSLSPEVRSIGQSLLDLGYNVITGGANSQKSGDKYATGDVYQNVSGLTPIASYWNSSLPVEAVTAELAKNMPANISNPMNLVLAIVAVILLVYVAKGAK